MPSSKKLMSEKLFNKVKKEISILQECEQNPTPELRDKVDKLLNEAKSRRRAWEFMIITIDLPIEQKRKELERTDDEIELYWDMYKLKAQYPDKVNIASK